MFDDYPADEPPWMERDVIDLTSDGSLGSYTEYRRLVPGPIRMCGRSLCVECGQPFTDDNPGLGNVNYLKHGNGCPDYIQLATSIIDDEVE